MYNDNLSYFSFDDIIIDVFICDIISCNILILYYCIFCWNCTFEKVAEINKWKWNEVLEDAAILFRIPKTI